MAFLTDFQYQKRLSASKAEQWMQDKSYLHAYDNLRCLATALLLHGIANEVIKRSFRPYVALKKVECLGRVSLGQSREQPKFTLPSDIWFVTPLYTFLVTSKTKVEIGMNKMKSTFDHEVL